MNYLVVEMQKNDSIASVSYSFNDRNEAMAKYHALLSVAAVSTVPVHTVVILTEDGVAIAHESFNHEIEEEIQS